MPINFTVVYDDLTNDVDDTTGDVAAVAVMSPDVDRPIVFVPSLTPGARIPALENLPRPAGLAIRGFPALLTTGGQLKNLAGGDVRLWANDPAWGLPRLQYTAVAPLLTDQFGREIPWLGVPFDAPTEDVTVNLALELPKPTQKFGRGRPGFGFARDGLSVNGQGQLVLTREDGQLLGAVDVPELSETLDEAQAQSVSYMMTFGR